MNLLYAEKAIDIMLIGKVNSLYGKNISC